MEHYKLILDIITKFNSLKKDVGIRAELNSKIEFNGCEPRTVTTIHLYRGDTCIFEDFIAWHNVGSGISYDDAIYIVYSFLNDIYRVKDIRDAYAI